MSLFFSGAKFGLFALFVLACSSPEKRSDIERPEPQSTTPKEDYIIALRKPATPSTATRILSAYNGEVVHKYRHALSGFSCRMSREEAKRLANDPRVRLMVKDQKFWAFDKVLFSKQQGQRVPLGVRRIGVPKNRVARIDQFDQRMNVDIAILDTGVDTTHPDLRVVKSFNYVPGETSQDLNGHGTHVAGIAAAIDNRRGIVGVAPGARIWSFKVLDKNGEGKASYILKALDEILSRSDEIEVINMSLGSNGFDDKNCGFSNDDPLHEAICRLVSEGVVIVAAAGNAGKDSASTVPAAYDEVITVSAFADTDGRPGGRGLNTNLGVDDGLATFSNHGRDVDVAAPGVNVISTWLDGEYRFLSGTSMAAPHVAGAVGLILSGSKQATSSLGVQRIRARIVRLGEHRGLRNDPDSSSEPILNVRQLDRSFQIDRPMRRRPLLLQKGLQNE